MAAQTALSPVPELTGMASEAAQMRRESMRLHPSNHRPERCRRPVPASSEDMLGRWERLRLVLVAQGLSEDEARTEAARIGATEVWTGFAGELRGHRAAGRQMDADVLALVLRSIQGVGSRLTRRPGDVPAARRTIHAAARRLRHNGGLLDRLSDHWNPAFAQARRTFESLEAFLAPTPHAA